MILIRKVRLEKKKKRGEWFFKDSFVCRHSLLSFNHHGQGIVAGYCCSEWIYSFNADIVGDGIVWEFYLKYNPLNAGAPDGDDCDYLADVRFEIYTILTGFLEEG